MLEKCQDDRISYENILKETASFKSTPINDRDLAMTIKRKVPEDLKSNEEKLDYFMGFAEVYEKLGHYSEAIRNMQEVIECYRLIIGGGDKVDDEQVFFFSQALHKLKRR